MTQLAVIFDTATGELRATDGSTSGPRPGGGFLISNFYAVLENRQLSEIDNGRRLDCLAPTATVTVTANLSPGWNCVLMPPRSGLTITPAPGVLLNGAAAPIARAFLVNLAVQVVQTAPNAYSVSGI